MKVRDVAAVLESIAPPHLAAENDNVGLLVGDGGAEVRRLMLCIDLTAAVLAVVAAGLQAHQVSHCAHRLHPPTLPHAQQPQHFHWTSHPPRLRRSGD